MSKHTSTINLRFLIQKFIRKFGLLEESCTPCGMPISVSKAHALMELLHSSGITQNELASRLFLSKSNVSRMLSRLLLQGHIHKIRDKSDGRIFRIRLTEKGRRLAKAVNCQSHKHFEKLSERLLPEQRDKIIDALGILIEAVQSPLNSGPKKAQFK